MFKFYTEKLCTKGFLGFRVYEYVRRIFKEKIPVALVVSEIDRYCYFVIVCPSVFFFQCLKKKGGALVQKADC